MGLDMYLIKRKKGVEPTYENGTDVAYWRKANQIHKWFVDNVQGGEDDCNNYIVTEDKLNDLLELCKCVKDIAILKDGMIENGKTFVNGEWKPNLELGRFIDNPEVIAELLPVSSGFFFGSTNYDEWYMRNVEETIDQLEVVLQETDFDTEEIYYRSSW